MAELDPRVDAYIAAAAPFAQPVLQRLRRDVHAACPGLVETMKWRMPFFVKDGRNFAFMAAFKAHCGFGFWRGGEAADQGKGGEAMGQFGRITALSDLPGSTAFKALVKQVAAQTSVATPQKKRPASAGRSSKG